MKKLQMYFVSSCIAFVPSSSEAGRVDVLNCIQMYRLLFGVFLFLLNGQLK